MPPGLSEEKISLVPLAVTKPPASNSSGPLTGGGNIIGLFQLSSFPLDKYISLSSAISFDLNQLLLFHLLMMKKLPHLLFWY